MAAYQRTITVPRVATGQTTRLVFGAINHRATVSVDGKVVGTNTTAYTDSTFDLTDFVKPGRTHRIEVRVEGRKALVGPDGRYDDPRGSLLVRRRRPGHLPLGRPRRSSRPSTSPTRSSRPRCRTGA